MGTEQGTFLSYPTCAALFKIIQIGSEFLANGAVAAIKFSDGEFITLACSLLVMSLMQWFWFFPLSTMVRFS